MWDIAIPYLGKLTSSAAGTKMIRTGVGILRTPDPVPWVDEVLAGVLIAGGSAIHGYHLYSMIHGESPQQTIKKSKAGSIPMFEHGYRGWITPGVIEDAIPYFR
jgi:hypothetical protein